MSDPIITIRNVTFSYNSAPVLKDVNLDIRKGDFTAVIGPNGGGKTTLVKLILGILKPDKGEIRIFGTAPKQAVSRTGYVPQDIHINRGFPISVLDVVRMGTVKGAGGWGSFAKKSDTVVRNVLEQVEMWDFRSRRMDDLSGGQRQRVYLARALVSNPDILLLDEPMSNIDTEGQTDFYDFLKEVNSRITIIVVSHDTMILTSHAKSVACVNRQLFFHDAPEITKEMLEMAYQCPVDIIGHGLPHRVLHMHKKDD